MNRAINYLKVLGYYFIVLIIYLLFISIFYYFEILSFKVINVISYVFMMILQCLAGIKISKIERKRGYLNGFVIGLIVFIIFSVITLLMKQYTLASLIYYLTLILSSMVGGIIGVPNEK